MGSKESDQAAMLEKDTYSKDTVTSLSQLVTEKEAVPETRF